MLEGSRIRVCVSDDGRRFAEQETLLLINKVLYGIHCKQEGKRKYHPRRDPRDEKIAMSTNACNNW